MTNIKNILMLSSAALLLSCMALPIEHDAWLTAQHSGVVRDMATGKPIAGAKVMLTSKYASSIIAETVSANDGSFKVGPVTRQARSYEVLPDIKAGVCEDTLEVKLAGYSPEKQDSSISANKTGGVCRSLSTNHLFLLKKLP
jgi:hypothetical protein